MSERNYTGGYYSYRSRKTIPARPPCHLIYRFIDIKLLLHSVYIYTTLAFALTAWRSLESKWNSVKGAYIDRNKS
jgi:hypothetical protein